MSYRERDVVFAHGVMGRWIDPSLWTHWAVLFKW